MLSRYFIFLLKKACKLKNISHDFNGRSDRNNLANYMLCVKPEFTLKAETLQANYVVSDKVDFMRHVGKIEPEQEDNLNNTNKLQSFHTNILVFSRDLLIAVMFKTSLVRTNSVASYHDDLRSLIEIF